MIPLFSLFDRADLGLTALSAAVLTHHSADLVLGCPLTLLRVRDGLPRRSRLRIFPSHLLLRLKAQQEVRIAC